MWFLILALPLLTVALFDLITLLVASDLMRRSGDINDAPCLVCLQHQCECGE